MRKRMGWQFSWVSSDESDFNYDFHASFTPDEMADGVVYYNYVQQPFPHPDAPGISVFYKDHAGEGWRPDCSPASLCINWGA